MDKVDGVARHVHYAARASNGDANEMRARLDTIVNHYKNIHTNCLPSSRCKIDPNYKPSRYVITNKTAEELLQNTIQKSALYKHAENFCHGKDTHYVESFNNVLNIFQDKRISFSSEQYGIRAKLATLHWNENVDRKFTSEWTKKVTKEKRGKVKRAYRKPGYGYRRKLWTSYVKSANKHKIP
jgi:hypothetical protein